MLESGQIICYDNVYGIWNNGFMIQYDFINGWIVFL